MIPQSWILATLLLVSLVEALRAATSKPHILLIVADDLGWNDVEYHGSRIKTPNIDKLALSGVRLENYYVQPVCTPSRSQLLSGRYQIHTSLQHVIIWIGQPNALPKEDMTIADKLKQAGYATHGVGKWHIGFWKKEFIPINRGFDSFYGYYASREDYYTHSRCGAFPGWKEGEHFCGVDFHENGKVVYNNTEYSTHLFTRKAQQIVEEHDPAKPLFLFLPYQAVHEPLQVPEEYTVPYKWIADKSRRTFAGMVSAMDEGVGNITETFKKKGLWGNTIVIFTTDNGGQIHQGGNNWPLKAWKASLFEGGIRGVSWVHSPLLKNPGRASYDLFHVTDWFPTLAKLAGLSLNDTKLDGYNIWDTISFGGKNPRKEILHNIDPLHGSSGESLFPDIYDIRVRSALRVGDWKLLTGSPGNGSWIAPPEDPLIHSDIEDRPKKKNLWLFNIRMDPTERQDLSETYPDVVRQMLQRLRQYNSTAVPAYYPPPDPKCNPALHDGAWVPWGDD